MKRIQPCFRDALHSMQYTYSLKCPKLSGHAKTGENSRLTCSVLACSIQRSFCNLGVALPIKPHNAQEVGRAAAYITLVTGGWAAHWLQLHARWRLIRRRIRDTEEALGSRTGCASLLSCTPLLLRWIDITHQQSCACHVAASVWYHPHSRVAVGRFGQYCGSARRASARQRECCFRA